MAGSSSIGSSISGSTGSSISASNCAISISIDSVVISSTGAVSGVISISGITIVSTMIISGITIGSGITSTIIAGGAVISSTTSG